MTAAEFASLQRTVRQVYRCLRPPIELDVATWNERHRRLDTAESARPGPYSLSITPYLREVLDCWTDPAVDTVVLVGGAQLGKTAAELGTVAYSICEDPSNGLMLFSSTEEAKKFAKLRFASLVRGCQKLRGRVREARGGQGGEAMLQRLFPGGALFLVSSSVPNNLASVPCRYLWIDEVDRLADNPEGDPIDLAMRRTTTFRNRKIYLSSTPTNRGTSRVEHRYSLGDQCLWCYPCPHCSKYVPITRENIKYEYEREQINGRNQYKITHPPEYSCPECGCISSENEMKSLQRDGACRWVPRVPENVKKNRCRSFWMNSFSSPFISWEYIIQEFLNADGDPIKLRVVYNTLFGELWDAEGTEENTALAEERYRRREEFKADLPEWARFLTVGVDTQDDYLFASVWAWGTGHECAAIAREIIQGRPDVDETWRALDRFLVREYQRPDGSRLRVHGGCVDTGGHFATECYRALRARMGQRPILLGIKGRGGDDVPAISPPKKIPIRGNVRETVPLVSLGSDALKHWVFAALRVEQDGPRCVHFPKGRGFDRSWFDGLFSERFQATQTARGLRYAFVKTHNRNEPLDTFCYAYAATRIFQLDLSAPRETATVQLPQASTTPHQPPQVQSAAPAPRRRGRSILDGDF